MAKALPIFTWETHMPRFEVLAGRHIDAGAGPKGEDVVYKRGDTFESDNNLDKMFLNKFRRVVEQKVTATPPVKPAVEEDNVEGAEAPHEEPKVHEHDVTAEFPTAKEADLKVFRVGKKYRIVDADQTDTQLHTGLFTKKQAAEFIATQSNG